MFANFLHMATIMLMPYRLFDIEEAAAYTRFVNFMLPRYLVGAITTEDEYVMAIEAFVDMMLDED